MEKGRVVEVRIDGETVFGWYPGEDGGKVLCTSDSEKNIKAKALLKDAFMCMDGTPLKEAHLPLPDGTQIPVTIGQVQEPSDEMTILKTNMLQAVGELVRFFEARGLNYYKAALCCAHAIELMIPEERSFRIIFNIQHVFPD